MFGTATYKKVLSNPLEKAGDVVNVEESQQQPTPQKLAVMFNKQELFDFLTDSLSKICLPAGKELVCTFNTAVRCNSPGRDTSQLEPCTHEEADSRIMVHVADCRSQGHQKISIRTTDTDVVVLAVSVVASLEITELTLLQILGKKNQYVSPCCTA